MTYYSSKAIPEDAYRNFSENSHVEMTQESSLRQYVAEVQKCNLRCGGSGYWARCTTGKTFRDRKRVDPPPGINGTPPETNHATTCVAEDGYVDNSGTTCSIFVKGEPDCTFDCLQHWINTSLGEIEATIHKTGNTL